MNNPQDDVKFFEYGRVIFDVHDFATETAAMDITIPCCLFQAITPQLLGAGFIDHLRIHQPIAVWMPQVTKERFNSLTDSPGAPDQVNVAVRSWLQQLLEIYEKLSVYLKDPTDLIPMLPLGTYIDFKWRCRIADILKVLEGVQSINVVGIPEFQWALASVLQFILEDLEQREQLVQHNKTVP